jgi:hypothetical protein
MIKIKLTDQGGYVVGDGPCPFNPDEFMTMFMDKIIEAKRAGLTELGIPDDTIDELKQESAAKILNAPVITLPESPILNDNRRQIMDVLERDV